MPYACRISAGLRPAFSEATCLGILPHVPADNRDDDAYLAGLAETSLDLDVLAT
jgi:hypothetical protein